MRPICTRGGTGGGGTYRRGMAPPEAGNSTVSLITASSWRAPHRSKVVKPGEGWTVSRAGGAGRAHVVGGVEEREVHEDLREIANVNARNCKC